jgi:hypothetical protein
MGQPCPECLDEGKVFAMSGWRSSCKIESYEIFTPYSLVDDPAFCFINTVEMEDSTEPAHAPILLVKVQFGNHELGPGAPIGRVSPHAGGLMAEVFLPRDEYHFFWETVRVGPENGFIDIAVNDDQEVVSFFVVVNEFFGVNADRREPLDAIRRRLRALTDPS